MYINLIHLYQHYIILYIHIYVIICNSGSEWHVPCNADVDSPLNEAVKEAPLELVLHDCHEDLFRGEAQLFSHSQPRKKIQRKVSVVVGAFE